MDVRVKPLVWEPSVINKPWHSAKAPWGYYYAQWDEETQACFASLEMGEVEAPTILSPSDVSTLDAAKAAAQADYEARILAALEPAPDLAELIEALTNLPAIYAHQINTGVREVYDPLQRFYTMESVLAALAKIKESTP